MLFEIYTFKHIFRGYLLLYKWQNVIFHILCNWACKLLLLRNTYNSTLTQPLVRKLDFCRYVWGRVSNIHFRIWMQSKILFSTSRLSVLPSLCPYVSASVRRLAPIPSGESQNVTIKSCSICLRGCPLGSRVLPNLECIGAADTS